MFDVALNTPLKIIVPESCLFYSLLRCFFFENKWIIGSFIVLVFRLYLEMPSVIKMQ